MTDLLNEFEKALDGPGISPLPRVKKPDETDPPAEDSQRIALVNTSRAEDLRGADQ